MSARRPRLAAVTRDPEAAAPPSATHFGWNLLALACTLAVIAYLRAHPRDRAEMAFLILAAAAIPVLIVDLVVLKVHRRATSGLDWERPFRLDVPRVLTKLLGLAATLGVMAFAYWLFPEYHGDFYDPVTSAVRRLAVPLAVVAVAYVAFVDGRMRAPRDAYWQLGRCVLGRFQDARRADLAGHARAWLVKAYFVPLMVVYLHRSVGFVVSFDLGALTWGNERLYSLAHEGIFLLDLAFCVAGYLLSLRLWDTHTRSAEPTMLGWVAALLCYQPFFSMFERNYLAYGGPGFGAALADAPALRSLCGGTILTLLAIYVLSTVAFGVRFSNLTHRGILTGGPYRFTKHPAYVSKNLAWWLMSMPFAVAGPGEALRRSVLLLLLNGVYFLRARTEERHLSRDPRYVEYALWMNEHGMFRALGRWLPFLRYRPPAGVAEGPRIDDVREDAGSAGAPAKAGLRASGAA